MKKNAQTDGSLALQNKQYRVITIEPTKAKQNAKLRVAAYARVSSASEDQLNSFAAQNRYYTTLISGKENWSMVDIYADEGITGTSAEKRNDFQRLLSDCRRGLIDRILVKSISRFARNTKECLEALRELKLLGVSVQFEKENIDTAVMSGEMMTALFASFAQAESESISGNMRWSVRKRMENGTYLPSSVPYGYTIVDRRIEIVPEEALIVCKIFQLYLSGHGKAQIARILNKDGISTGQGKHWTYTTVHYILGNERYIGDSLWQKTYASDTFPPYKIKNQGEREKFYAIGTHPPIVTKDIFNAAQCLASQRETKFGRDNVGGFPLSKKIICGTCGGYFRRKEIRGKIYWTCLAHEQDSSKCVASPIAEEQIYSAFLRVYYNLKHQGNDILCEMITYLQTIRSRRMLWSEDVIELNKKISDLSSQNQMLAQLMQQGLIDSDIFIYQSNELAQQLREAKLKKERLLAQNGDCTLEQTQDLLDILAAGPAFLDTFDADLFHELVDKIIVESSTQVRFRLKNGLELPETIERTVR